MSHPVFVELVLQHSATYNDPPRRERIGTFDVEQPPVLDDVILYHNATYQVIQRAWLIDGTAQSHLLLLVSYAQSSIPQQQKAESNE